MDWFYKGYFKIAEPYGNDAGTIAQYLQYGSMPKDGTKPLNPVGGPTYPDGKEQKLMTLEEFKDAEIDIVIATYWQHIIPYNNLIRAFHPKAKLIHQMGNNWADTLNWSVVKNLLASTAPIDRVPSSINVCYYHQEFDTNVFKPKPATGKKKITCFMNALDNYPDTQMLYELEDLLTDWEFKFYGAGSRDGTLQGHDKMVKEMHDSKFILHIKEGGDGFGHIIFNSFAVGVPPIVKMEYYEGQLAGKLMKDTVTCIAIDGLSVENIASKIRAVSDDEDIYKEMCEGAHQAFKDNVDYKKEEKEIRKFLDNLI